MISYERSNKSLKGERLLSKCQPICVSCVDDMLAAFNNTA